MDYTFEAELHQNAMNYWSEMREPSMMLKPKLSIDGNKWRALYGDNLQDGVSGFGSSPHKAYLDFNKNWYKNIGE